MDSFLVTQGVKTLPLRMEQHSRSAQQVAEFLEMCHIAGVRAVVILTERASLREPLDELIQAFRAVAPRADDTKMEVRVRYRHKEEVIEGVGPVHRGVVIFGAGWQAVPPLT